MGLFDRFIPKSASQREDERVAKEAAAAKAKADADAKAAAEQAAAQAKVKEIKFAKGGKIDGIAQRGKTRGRIR